MSGIKDISWFRWVPGMRTTDGRRVSWVVDGVPGGIIDGDARVRPNNAALAHDAEPDMDDAPTVAAVMWLLSGRLTCQGAAYLVPGWEVRCVACEGFVLGKGDNVTEAILAAAQCEGVRA